MVAPTKPRILGGAFSKATRMGPGETKQHDPFIGGGGKSTINYPWVEKGQKGGMGQVLNPTQTTRRAPMRSNRNGFEQNYPPMDAAPLRTAKPSGPAPDFFVESGLDGTIR